MTEDIDLARKNFIQEVEKLAASLSSEEIALLLTMKLDCLLAEMRNEFKQYRQWYLAKESNLSTQAIRNFFQAKFDPRAKTLTSLARVYALLKRKPLPETHVARVDSKENLGSLD